MLEFLGTLGGNILSLPGVLGLAVGMMTRNVGLACVFGGVVGIIELLVFGKFTFAGAGLLEIVLSIAVGMAAGVIGSLIRRKGTTA